MTYNLQKPLATYFLCLGSNVEDRFSNLKKAVTQLKKNGIRVVKLSSIYVTQPTDFQEQPDFLNQVVKVKTPFFPLPLLRAVKNIEKEYGRKKTVRFGPRPIDIDILWWDGGEIQRKNLIVPHVRAAQRKFVLVPWAEIAGKNFMLQGKPLKEWIYFIEKSGDNQNVKKHAP